jgi:hypothetical protein
MRSNIYLSNTRRGLVHHPINTPAARAQACLDGGGGGPSCVGWHVFRRPAFSPPRPGSGSPQNESHDIPRTGVRGMSWPSFAAGAETQRGFGSGQSGLQYRSRVAD